MQHIPDYSNNTADALSHLQVQRFHGLQPRAHPLPSVIPQELWTSLDLIVAHYHQAALALLTLST